MDDRTTFYNHNYYAKRNGFSLAAMILGICSIAMLCTFFLPLPLGALGCLFVILSRRSGEKLTGTARTGLITSIIGMAAGILLWAAVFASAFILLNPDNRDSLDELYESTYGMDFEEYMEQFYGEDFEQYLEQFDQLYQ